MDGATCRAAARHRPARQGNVHGVLGQASRQGLFPFAGQLGIVRLRQGVLDAVGFLTVAPTLRRQQGADALEIANVDGTSPGGTSATSKKDLFEYVPAVEGVAPHSGLSAGGTPVTISGTGFAPGIATTTFKFGSKLATEVSCSSYTTCTSLTPANKVGTVAVVAEVGKAKSAANPLAQFTYE